MHATIRVQREDFDPGVEIDRITGGDTSVGGICTFIGTVRGNDEGAAVASMTLEHYPGMTERALEEIAADAERRWPLHGVTIIHRYGRLEPGERIVLVVTASRHRDAAFEACQFLMDWLKTKAPFWKLEETESGQSWVDARESDDAAAARWEHEEN